ncbi:MAG TPA: cytochrome c [Flavobacteriales bacterium]|nr:cytochrome c [Flavobacteriales bacterium]HNK40647.1 cytochrome c [Flavobacteriales bacterium]HNM69958.1 cytochrome c [Flavobacteriales bacterium]
MAAFVLTARHRRTIFVSLVLLFIAQSAITYTTATSVKNERAMYNEAASRGAQLYRDLNCTACHQLYGLGGYMGPDLTNTMGTPGKGPAYAKAFILHGTQRMPALGVTPEQADDIVAFLQAVDATGTHPIRHIDLTPWGTYRSMHDDAR